MHNYEVDSVFMLCYTQIKEMIVMEWYKYDIRLMSDDDYEYWYSLMSDEKKQRVDAFRYKDDKKRTVAGEMLVRKVLSGIYYLPCEYFSFCTKENGKPFVRNFDKKFSISHSGDYVVCAVDDKEVGIDIERIRPVNLSVCKRFFTDAEKLYVFGKKPDEQDFKSDATDDMNRRFFEVWTYKESCVKLNGSGIADIHSVFDYDRHTEIFDGYVVTIATVKN